jgi:hypothetical protein
VTERRLKRSSPPNTSASPICRSGGSQRANAGCWWCYRHSTRPARSSCSTGRTTRTSSSPGCTTSSPGHVIRERYGHINAFERLLHDEGTQIVKILLHISFEEQGKRLEERRTDPAKSWKFKESDLAE